jgi:hypothetical protein
MAEERGHSMQVQTLSQLCPLLRLNPLRKLLNLHEVPYEQKDSVHALRKHLANYLKRLTNGKHVEYELSPKQVKRNAERRRLCQEGPQPSGKPSLLNLAEFRKFSQIQPKFRQMNGFPKFSQFVEKHTSLQIWLNSDTFCRV